MKTVQVADARRNDLQLVIAEIKVGQAVLEDLRKREEEGVLARQLEPTGSPTSERKRCCFWVVAVARDSPARTDELREHERLGHGAGRVRVVRLDAADEARLGRAQRAGQLVELVDEAARPLL